MPQGIAKPFKRKVSIYAIAGVLMLVAGAWLAAWFTRTSPSHPPGPLEQVTLAASIGYAGTCSIFAAQEKGYFAHERLAIRIQPHTTGKFALDAALQGQADLATVADVPIMFATMNGQPVSIVATIFKEEKDHGIVGRKDRGVVTPASLEGKRIGVTIGSSGHFVLAAFLNRQKLSITEVMIVDLQPEDLSGALAQGRVDAVATWEPFLEASLAELGTNGASFPAEGLYEGVFNIAGSRDYVVNHPETIKRLLRAVVKGGRFCTDVPDAAREILSNVMKTDARKLQKFWPSYRFDITLEQSLVLALEDETRWAIKNKLTPNTDMPNYLNSIYLDALKAVSPAAVTIIH